MENSGISLYYILGAATLGSIYFISLLVGALMLLTPLWKNSPYKPNKVQKVSGYVMLLFLADLTLWAFALAECPGYHTTPLARFCEGMDVIAFASTMLIGEALCKPKSMNLKVALGFLWPFFVMQIACLFFPYKIFIHIYTALGFVFIFIMLVRQRMMIRRYNKSLTLYYSEVESLRRNWYYRIMTILVFLEMSYFIAGFLCDRYAVDTATRCLIFLSYDVMCSVVLGIFVNFMLRIKEEDDGEDAAATPSGDEDMEGSEPIWTAELERVMNEERPYLESDISLASLARLVGTNRTYLSGYLNREKNVNFYEYVNGFRLEYAAKLLKETSNAINDVARESGFSDMRVFRKLFKARYGCLPSQFVRKD